MTTSATVIERKRIEHRDDEGDIHYTYHVHVRYDVGGRQEVLWAESDKRTYNRAQPTTTLPIQYAKGHPHIALLEGEWGWRTGNTHDQKGATNGTALAERTAIVQDRRPPISRPLPTTKSGAKKWSDRPWSLIVLGAFICAYPFLDDRDPALFDMLWLLSIGTLVVVAGIVGTVREQRTKRQARRALAEGSTTTSATVIEREQESTPGYASASHTYFVHVQFRAGGREQLLRAEVGKEIYDRAVTGTQLGIRYANADPRIALLEGERGYAPNDMGHTPG